MSKLKSKILVVDDNAGIRSALKILLPTRFVDVELIGDTASIADSHLIEIGEMLIDLLDVFLVGEVLADAFLKFSFVGVVIEQHGIRFASITSRPTCFLEVGLDGVGAIEMNHQSHIRLVNTHSEGVGGHDDANLVIMPTLLAVVFHRMVEPCVEVGRRVGGNLLVQVVGNLFRSPTTSDVNDGATSDGREDVDELSVFVGGVANNVCQVLAFKTHLEHIRLPELQLLLDVVDDTWGCCGCESEDGGQVLGVGCWVLGDGLAYFRNLQISRSEVISPLTDAMGLVDCDEADPHVSHFCLEQIRRQSFGRYI